MTIRMPAAERIGHISGTTTTCIHGIAGTNKDCAKYPPGRPGSGGPAILHEVFSTVLERRPEFQGPLLPLRLVGRRGRFGDDGVADSSSSPWRCPSLPVQHHPPVPSVAEALDRWRVGDGEQALRSEFLDVLAMVPDPRDLRAGATGLGALLAIRRLGYRGRRRGYARFATWARTVPEDVLAQLGIRIRRPSEKTFRAVLARVDPDDLNRRLGPYLTAHVTRLDPAGLVPIALDGKTLRGALRAKATATHLVSVFAHRARLVLGQLAVAEKSNEIPCVRRLLKLLPRRVRWLVTVDALCRYRHNTSGVTLA
jgi:hypothetical protein